MSDALRDRVALVTGGGRGIGRAIALRLARSGARVAVLARSVSELEQTAALIADQGKSGLAVVADVSDPSGVEAALAAVRSEMGPVNVLVNNAAVVWPLGPSAEIDLGEWAAAVAINVTGVARLSFGVLPGMLERRWGRIVNVSSGIAASPAAMLRANAYATTNLGLSSGMSAGC